MKTLGKVCYAGRVQGETDMFSQRTTTALLEGLHDPANVAAWEELDRRCRPLMLAVARRIGLDAAAADDAVQSTMLSFCAAYGEGRYDRSRGRLSGFLITILRSRALDIRRGAARRREVDGSGVTPEVPSEAEITRYWLAERQSQILTEAIAELLAQGADARMVEAFELFGLRRVAIEEVTARLGMTRDEVYNAKFRITQRLKPIVALLDELYEDL
jgi:RNA polymerase sigma factor (sigma-70 family)